MSFGGHQRTITLFSLHKRAWCGLKDEVTYGEKVRQIVVNVEDLEASLYCCSARAGKVVLVPPVLEV